MNADQIKAAASQITDLERIEQILSDIKRGSDFTLLVGTASVFLDRSRCEPVASALTNYLTGAAAVLKQQLGHVDGIEDPMDAVISQLDDDARKV